MKHVFDNPTHDHKLGGFLDSFNGNQTQAYNAVQQAMQKLVNAEGMTGLIRDMVINVNGFDITVRGMIVDGIFKIGTFFIP